MHSELWGPRMAPRVLSVKPIFVSAGKLAKQITVSCNNQFAASAAATTGRLVEKNMLARRCVTGRPAEDAQSSKFSSAEGRLKARRKLMGTATRLKQRSQSAALPLKFSKEALSVFANGKAKKLFVSVNDALSSRSTVCIPSKARPRRLPCCGCASSEKKEVLHAQNFQFQDSSCEARQLHQVQLQSSLMWTVVPLVRKHERKTPLSAGHGADGQRWNFARTPQARSLETSVFLAFFLLKICTLFSNAFF